ncbi:hypothetical protein PoB_001735200 [Plakobranchus ocellatus]|uniref:Uncharacterized protein n=1 Tax=Plakobranchus ocellatus TaxID=259542 RepID=A0AAV3Z8K8_9GAST|nr:hypothetical protein PoB_001735200 [Plakobranchus ocellatus]
MTNRQVIPPHRNDGLELYKVCGRALPSCLMNRTKLLSLITAQLVPLAFCSSIKGFYKEPGWESYNYVSQKLVAAFFGKVVIEHAQRLSSLCGGYMT